MMEKLKILLTGLMVSCLVGCTVPGTFMNSTEPPTAYKVQGQLIQPTVVELSASWLATHPQFTNYSYRVGPWDILNIIVWDHPELTTPTTQLSNPTESGFLVSAEGYIDFPFAGELKVAGLTLPQIQNLIANRVKKYIRDPQVTARVVDFRSKQVQVLGQVGLQIMIPITDRPLTLFDALNQAGGVDRDTANTARIFIVRGQLKDLTVFWVNTQSPQDMMVAQQFILRNNDLVYVPPTGLSTWNRMLNQILPTFGAASIVRSTVE